MSQPIYQLVTDRILALLEQGVVPWKKPWKTTGQGAVPPANLVSGRRYQGINVFLLIAQGFSSPYWLTFKQARDLGGHVRRGEHGTPIVFWRIDQETPEEEDGEETATPRRILLKYYVTFNIEQCEGIEIPGAGAIDDGPAFDPIPACEAVYANMPNRPVLRHGGERAFYRRGDDLVQMPRPEAFRRREHYFSTLYHELSHASGHRSRLNRLAEEHDSGVFGSPGYSREELVAEMAAAMICGVVGIAPVKVESIAPAGEEEILENAAAYIRHWMDVLQSDTRAVVIAAARAQKAADYILGRQDLEGVREREEAA